MSKLYQGGEGGGMPDMGGMGGAPDMGGMPGGAKVEEVD